MRLRTRAPMKGDEIWEISDLLRSATHPDDVLAVVFSRLAQLLPWRTIVLLDATTPRTRTLVWSTDQARPRHVTRARAYALRTFQFLVGRAGASSRSAALPVAPHDDAFLFLPLASAQPASGAIGALQVEPVDDIDEQRIVLVNGIANQLAIALERRRFLERERRARDVAVAAERRLCLLSRVSSSLSADAHVEQRIRDVLGHLAPAFCRAAALVRGGSTFVEAAPDLMRSGAAGELALIAADLASEGGIDGASWSIDLRKSARRTPSVTTARVPSALVVPLEHTGERFGTLVLFARAALDRQDAALAEELGLRVAGALRAEHERTVEEERRRRVDDALNAVAHDLRGPLNVISLATSALSGTSDDATPLQRIGRACDHMRALVDDLLDVGRAERGMLVLDTKEHDVRQIVDEAIEGIEDVAARRSIRLSATCSVDVGTCELDAPRFARVLWNLLGNAVKFTPRGGRVTLVVAAAGDHVRFSVSDTGPGIDAAHLEHVFERFWQAPSTATLGTGLGLYIVRQIVEAHGGRVSVESEPGVGATFHVVVPRRRHAAVVVRAGHG